MNRCKTCIHWVPERDDDHGLPYSMDDDKGERIRITPREDWEEDTTSEFLAPGLLRICAHPSITFFRIPPKGGATVVDGSEYTASLLTTPEFGCTLHEKDPNA